MHDLETIRKINAARDAELNGKVKVTFNSVSKKFDVVKNTQTVASFDSYSNAMIKAYELTM